MRLRDDGNQNRYHVMKEIIKHTLKWQNFPSLRWLVENTPVNSLSHVRKIIHQLEELNMLEPIPHLHGKYKIKKISDVDLFDLL